MSRTAAHALAPYGIRVNCIFPGPIDTPMLGPIDRAPGANAGRTPLGRLGTAEEIARLALFLASDESSFCTGAEFVADGGVTA